MSRHVPVVVTVAIVAVVVACRPATQNATTTVIPDASVVATANPTASSASTSTVGAISAGDSGPPTVSKTASALACLTDVYGGRVDAEREAIVLPSGTRLAWSDGKSKKTAERIDAPDLEDMLALGYPAKGTTITPVIDEEADPGRIRFEALFRHAYGETAPLVTKNLVPVPFPTKASGKTVSFHSKAAPALGRVADRLEVILRADPSLGRFFKELGGTFNARNIAGTDRASAHSWGIAIDIDTSLSDYWRNVRGAGSARKEDAGPTSTWRNRIPQSIVDAFEAEGFAWGGRWWHYDTMHFEYRPELFDPRCAL